jgi:hypothetical protein
MIQVFQLLLPVFVSSVLAFFIAYYTTRRQLNRQNLPKLIEFDQKLERLIAIPAKKAKRAFTGQVDVKDAIKIMIGFTETCREIRKLYPPYIPHLKKHHRRSIESELSKFEAFEERLTNSYLQSPGEDIEDFANKLGDPPKLLSEIGQRAFEINHAIHRIVKQNIHEIS